MTCTNYILCGVLAISLLGSCASSGDKSIEDAPAVSAEARPAKPADQVRIYVSRDGKVFLNGGATELNDLQQALIALKQKGGTVFYSRDDQQQDPHEAAIQVMDLIAGQELPIQFYTDSTFLHVVEF